jgi:hypothetical protein
MLNTLAGILAAVSVAFLLAACGVDAGARLGPYGTRAGINVGEATPPAAIPGTVVIANPTTDPALPAPLPPQ